MKPERGNRGITFSFFYLGARWRWLVKAMLRPLYSHERRGTRYTGVGLRAHLDECGFDPRTAKPVASRYAGYSIPAQLQNKIIFNL